MRPFAPYLDDTVDGVERAHVDVWWSLAVMPARCRIFVLEVGFGVIEWVFGHPHDVAVIASVVFTVEVDILVAGSAGDGGDDSGECHGVSLK